MFILIFKVLSILLKKYNVIVQNLYLTVKLIINIFSLELQLGYHFPSYSSVFSIADSIFLIWVCTELDEL